MAGDGAPAGCRYETDHPAIDRRLVELERRVGDLEKAGENRLKDWREFMDRIDKVRSELEAKVSEGLNALHEKVNRFGLQLSSTTAKVAMWASLAAAGGTILAFIAQQLYQHVTKGAPHP